MAANGGQCHMCDPRAASLAGVLKLEFGVLYRCMRPNAHRAAEAGVAQLFTKISERLGAYH